MHSYIRPNSEVVLKLPSGVLRIVKIAPNTTISIPKIGTFAANLLIGRPFHFTYELLDQHDSSKETNLRVVPVDELNLEIVTNKTATPAESRDEEAAASDGLDSEPTGQNKERNNRLTVDDPSRQALTMEEIEELKKANPGSGKEIIEQIIASHSGIKEKTAFALAKYTLRKSKKYMKRFTVLPLDVNMLTEIMLEKDPMKIMELREEVLGLIMSWSNVHYSQQAKSTTSSSPAVGGGRWLVVDDTGGLVVAAMAERMGLLYKDSEEDSDSDSDSDSELPSIDSLPSNNQSAAEEPTLEPEAMQIDSKQPKQTAPKSQTTKSRKFEAPPKPATSNTITVLHANPQPNLSFLKYFGYSPEDPSSSQDHPLYTNLKTVTWLQVANPAVDSLYHEPPVLSEAALSGMKSGKRGNYYRKRIRWEKVKKVVDETREGGFDGLVVASTMEPVGIMKQCVPLIRGGGNIVVYSPSAEPLTALMDIYSRDRKGAYVRVVQAAAEEGKDPVIDEKVDFPLNPTLLLNPMLQTARAREWQVLPGRTHPLMTSKGGSEGFLFTATRVLPNTRVKVEARGKFTKKRKVPETPVAKEGDGCEEGSKKSKAAEVAGGAEVVADLENSNSMEVEEVAGS